jgi:hypothetical protein
MRLSSPSFNNAAAPQPPFKCAAFHRIDDFIGGDTAFARHDDPPMHQVQFCGRVGVGIDAHHAAEIERTLVPPPVEVQTPGISIHFNGHASFGACREDPFDVYFITRPSEQLAAGHVAQDRYRRM